ncbi:DUF5134 domain-containing protein [Arthrobacter sp. MA-N2]|uniref:DUF5134 domain-containing protein n=1 Tax=Arthrobacter sp. MA-N2 TaxID=1101188 RepID=UPI003FA41049
MLWNLAPTTLLAQIAVLTGAALWFTIQAVARPEFKTLCTTAQGRLKCAYHALTMAGAALMIRPHEPRNHPRPGNHPRTNNDHAHAHASHPPHHDNNAPQPGNPNTRSLTGTSDPPGNILHSRSSNIPHPPTARPTTKNHPPQNNPTTPHPHKPRTRSPRRHHHGPHVRHHDINNCHQRPPRPQATRKA